MTDARRKFVVCSAFQTPACCCFANSAPLFEKEGDSAFLALISQSEHPIFFHRSGSRSTFAADYHPVDALQIQFTQIF